ncbi:MAG: DUF1460 domain-containing protein [Myxococcales bacterium]|nr:DUF1460 domain-containing protein [Myxococcales bacterium]
MSQASPNRASDEDVQALIDVAWEGNPTLPERLDRLSSTLLGKPYVAFGLVGGPDEPEQLVTKVDGFDCVTFAETVWALAQSRTSADFPEQLTALRYHGARCSWASRNHYMSRWIQRNIAAGHAEPLLLDEEIDTGQVRDLSCLPRYPVQRWPVRYVPSAAVPALTARARMGDLVGFMSDKDDLDTFHVGLLAPVAGQPLAVRHAGRSRSMVVHQDLVEFLEDNDVPGMLLARPLEAP